MMRATILADCGLSAGQPDRLCTAAADTNADTPAIAPLTPTPVVPSFGPIEFGLGVVDDAGGTSRHDFPGGHLQSLCRIYAPGMSSDVVWRREWYFNGQPLEDARATEHWTRTAQGSAWLSMYHARAALWYVGVAAVHRRSARAACGVRGRAAAG
ncbi:MAG: hypothetical protein HZY76_02350 [Anaerolineae bacterium]|nr:MAG: hypothetical protein HZY76_02350 [Anaerolineae bacterium]